MKELTQAIAKTVFPDGAVKVHDGKMIPSKRKCKPVSVWMRYVRIKNLGNRQEVEELIRKQYSNSDMSRPLVDWSALKLAYYQGWRV